MGIWAFEKENTGILFSEAFSKARLQRKTIWYDL